MTYYDPDDLLIGAAIIYLVGQNIRTAPKEMVDNLIKEESMVIWDEMQETWSNALIAALIKMGFDHDEVHEMAEQHLEEMEEKRTEEVAGNILDQLEEN